MNLISQILQDLSLIPTIITNSMRSYTPFRGQGVILLWFYQHNNTCLIESPFSYCKYPARKTGGTICNIISQIAILGRGNCIRVIFISLPQGCPKNKLTTKDYEFSQSSQRGNLLLNK